ncbi:MAG: M4 family metallopeptidase [Ignavibacteriales bacterium]|nr:M4 family metallopeptidase [Ignavibacteriales bacterium]
MKKYCKIFFFLTIFFISGHISRNVCESQMVTGYGTSQYNGDVSFQTSTDGSGYRLKDSWGISTCEYDGSYPPPIVQAVFNTNTNWGSTTVRSAVSAHWAFEQTYSYFYYRHGKTGINRPINILVKYIHKIYDRNNVLIDQEYNIAAWDNIEKWFIFGDGENTCSPWVALDACAHEYTHAVIYNELGFTGAALTGEIGGMTEGFADIFGTSVEFYTKENYPNNIIPNWIVGSDIGCYLTRALSNERAYKDKRWGTNPDEHNMAEVLGYAFYLIANGSGGVDTNEFGKEYNVEGIGMHKAERIAYKVLNEKLTTSSTFENVGKYFLDAAISIYSFGSIEYLAVEQAIIAVNLSHAITVKNDFNGGYCYVSNNLINFDKHENLPTTFDWVKKTNHIIKAENQNFVDPSNGVNYFRVFDYWDTDDNDETFDATRSVHITKDITYTAYYNKQFNINIEPAFYVESSTGGYYEKDGVNIGSSLNTTFTQTKSSPFTVKAVPPTGYIFVGWSDNVYDNPRVILPTDHVNIYAIYKKHLASTTSFATKLSGQRKLIVEGDKKYAVYESGGMIFFIYDLGTGWSNEYRVFGSANAKNPSISSNANYVYIVWDQQDVFGKHAVLLNKIFKNGVPIPFNEIIGESDEDNTPVADDLFEHGPNGSYGPVILWREKSTAYTGLRLSVVYGSNYQIASNSRQPSILRYGDKHHLVYVNSIGQVVYQNFLIDNVGAMYNQTTPLVISGSYTDCSNPSIAVNSDGRIFVAWDGLNGTARYIFVKECDASGAWQTVSEFTHGTHILSSPSIGIDKQTLKVNVVFDCGNHLARKSKSLSGSTWYTLCDMCQGYGPAVSSFEDDPYTPTYPTTYFTSGTSQPYSIISNVLGAIPAIPMLSTPTDAQENVSINPILSWDCTFDASKYHLQVSRTSDFAEENLILDHYNITNTSYQISNLTYSITYYWQVKAINEAGESGFSPTRSFTTTPDPFPGPSLSGTKIVDGTVRRPKLTWTSVPGATSYILYRHECGEINDCDDGVDQSSEIVYQGSALTFTDYSMVVAIKYGNGYVNYIVRAKNAQNQLSGRSNTVSYITNYDIIWKNGARDGEIPEDTRLEASYPNPFNPLTTVRYQIAKTSNVSLSIYNQLGQQVALLTNETQEAGYYERTWDATNIPSGIYYLRLLVTDEDGKQLYLNTEKAVVIK